MIAHDVARWTTRRRSTVPTWTSFAPRGRLHRRKGEPAPCVCASCRNDRRGHAPRREVQSRQRHHHRDRRRAAARCRRGGDGGAHRSGGGCGAAIDCAARSRPDSSFPMRAPTSPAARWCCDGARASARARSACWRPAASRRSRWCASRKSPCSPPATSWSRPAMRCSRRGVRREQQRHPCGSRHRSGRRADHARHRRRRRGRARARRSETRSRAAIWYALSAAPRRAPAISPTGWSRGWARPASWCTGSRSSPASHCALAVVAGKPLVVLPGFPTSAIFTFHAFVGAGHPGARRVAAARRSHGRGGAAGAHRLRARPQGIRAGGAGGGRARSDRVPDPARARARSLPSRRPTDSPRSTCCFRARCRHAVPVSRLSARRPRCPISSSWAAIAWRSMWCSARSPSGAERPRAGGRQPRRRGGGAARRMRPGARAPPRPGRHRPYNTHLAGARASRW